MTDPYRPGYHQPTTYTPPQPDQYASGALTTRHHPPNSPSYPSQSNMQLSQSSHRPSSSDSKYLDPASTHRHHHHKPRSHSHRGDRDRSKSRTKEWGSTAVGAAAGGLLGSELGHGPLATIGGLVAGAYGAHELERRHERHRERKRGSDGRGDGERQHRRRSSGGWLEGLKGKVEGFLEDPDKDDRRGGRRSRSSVGGRRGGDGYGGYGYESDGYESDGYEERRGGKGGRSSRRDEYY